MCAKLANHRSGTRSVHTLGLRADLSNRATYPVRIAQSFARIRVQRARNLAEVANLLQHMLDTPGRHRPMLIGSGPIFGQRWPGIGKHRPHFADDAQTSAKFGQIWSGTGRTWSEFGPAPAKFAPDSSDVGFGPGSTTFRAIPTEVGPKSTNFGQCLGPPGAAERRPTWNACKATQHSVAAVVLDTKHGA